MNKEFSAESWKFRLLGLSAVIAGAAFFAGIAPVEAARISDIRATKHNLGYNASGTYAPRPGQSGTVPSRNISASSETQICVFCHTPHAATAGATPLWNRKVAGSGYTQNYVLYDSSTLDAKQVQGSLNQPGGSSKLCLSCHDGTVAIGNVNVLNGADRSSTPIGSTVITMTGGTFMPTGEGTTTGFTRNLGVDLTNDHPISISYNDQLADRDGEMRRPSDNPTLIGVRTATVKPKLPLQNTGSGTSYDPDGGGPLSAYSIRAQMQCTTCHDPHIRETDEATVGNQKFLRLNRFQQAQPAGGAFDEGTSSTTGDIICLACHDKAGTAWAFSAHAHKDVADETYKTTAANRREFPSALPVYKAACLNCHDTHTIAGARRLLREGASGGASAIEETCYQCHRESTNSAIEGGTGGAPDIRTDFVNKTIRMPITGTETHDISSNFSDGIVNCSTNLNDKCGKDFMESRDNLKLRHAECTDCHNPHRVIRASNGLPGLLAAANTKEDRPTTTALGGGSSGGHHPHATTTTHSNKISGVLRGSWGVEPTYSANASFFNVPTGYDIKRGDPGSSTSSAASETYVTREYQICLKCHSDYGYVDDNSYPSGGSRPLLATATGTGKTVKDISRVANSYTRFTNQAREFQAPAAHKANATTTDSGAAINTGSNRRSWHPVMDSTGRGTAERGGLSANNWLAPWNNAVGTQTMYCTDCHGSDNGTAANVVPTIGTTAAPWGPHGSNNNFLLKGVWTTSTGAGADDSHLCFKCHSRSVYTGNGTRTGFYVGSRMGTGKDQDGHKIHNDKTSGIRCNWCHVAVPHGWKNKALLVNLNDVGPEAGLTAGTVIADAAIDNVGYSNGPYYRNAMLKVDNWAASGNWAIGDCGPIGAGEDAARAWMKDNVCNNPP